MRWIQASLTLVVLLLGLALGHAGAAEEWPGRLDGPSAGSGCGDVHDGRPEADSHRGAVASFDLADSPDGSNPSLALRVDDSDVGLRVFLDRLIPAPPFEVQPPSIVDSRQAPHPASRPSTAAGRLAFLQRFLL